MQIVQVVPHIDSEASGPTYSVRMLSQSIAASGVNVSLYSQREAQPIPGVTVKAFPEWKQSGRFAVSPKMATALFRAAREVDIVHNHSLWSMCNVIAGWSVRGAKSKLVFSPRGTLSDWALKHSAIKKKFLWPLQKQALFGADMVHATCIDEMQDVRKLGYAGPVVVLSNGIDLPERVATFSGAKRQLLFLSRLHPKKGIEMLLQAWGLLESDFPHWELAIVGVGEESYVTSLKSLMSNLRIQRVSMPGGLYGEKKSNAYLQSNLFVLPTYSENFGMVVAEALAHAVPVISTKGAPWRELPQRGCGWWVDISVDALRGTLKEAMATSRPELQRMGLLGRKWMEEEFDWGMLGSRMTAAYRWLLGRTERRPSWVFGDRL